jgi:hypothetical protein
VQEYTSEAFAFFDRPPSSGANSPQTG